MSAYVSLDDLVTCDDLAIAMEEHIVNAGISESMLRQTAVICHSTGAIVTRRWILNRLNADPPKALPSHLITLAGANHGSTLSQLGRTAIARVFHGLVQNNQVGEEVLADLDYGSAFLWSLNAEWLQAWNRGLLRNVNCFSIGGDKHWVDPLQIPVPGWQFMESGSDSIVRISGANLNYSMLTADASTGLLRPTRIDPPAPHLVIPGYTHGRVLGAFKQSPSRPFKHCLAPSPLQTKRRMIRWLGSGEHRPRPGLQHMHLRQIPRLFSDYATNLGGQLMTAGFSFKINTGMLAK